MCVEKWPDIKSYSRLLLAKVREGRARNPTEKLKETVTCGLDEKQSLFGRGLSPGDRNELGCLPFLSILLVGRGNSFPHIRAQEEKERKWLKESHRPRTANQSSPRREGETLLPGSKLAQHPPRSKPKTPPCLGPHSHAFGETVNTAPGFAAIVDDCALASTLLIRKAGIFLTAFPSEKIKLPFFPDVCR